MSTTYTPSHGASSAPLAYAATRYTGAASLCAAIRAAAALAPEVAPECEFPERYVAGHYPHFVAAEYEIGTPLRVGPSTETGRERIETEGPASYWPHVKTHPEAPGPFLPMPTDARAVFAYGTPDGARGSLTVANLRGALLALADKVHAQRGAFDGKAKRAAKPSKPASSAPHVAARALWDAKDYAGALQLAANVGALYFGVGGQSGAPFPYMAAEPIELAGHGFTLARSIQTGRFRVLYSACGLSVDSSRAGAPQDDGFKTQSAAMAWIESAMAEDAFRERIAAAAGKVAAFDQAAALAHYMGADAAPDDETEAPARELEAAATVAAETAPDALAARYSFEFFLIGTDSQIVECGRHECAGPGLTQADQDAAGATLRTMAAAHGRRIVSTAFAAYGLRAWCEPLQKPAPIIRARVAVLTPALHATSDWAHKSEAARRVHWAHSQACAIARGILADMSAADRDASGEFEFSRSPADRCGEVLALRARVAAELRARRAATRPPATHSRPMAAPAVTVRHVSPAEFAHTVAVAQLKSAAATLARASLAWAPDSGRGSAIAEARAGNLSAAPAVLAHLQRIAENGRTADGRADAAEEVRALADALAEHGRESAAPLATQSAPATVPTIPEIFERMQHRTPYPYQPQFARIAIERLDADCALRTSARLNELLDAYARTYGAECSQAERDSAHYTCSRRFPDFPRADPLPTQPAPAACPMLAARTAAVLDKPIRCDGEVMTRRAFIESKVAAGLRPSCEQLDRIKPLSRMQFFRASNEEQRAHDARIKAGGKKDVFYVGGFEVTKTEHDHAAALVAAMPAPLPAKPEAAPADALRQQIDGMHPHDVYDVLADNGFETEATRFLSVDGQRDALEVVAREVGALAFSGMLAKLTGDDEPAADEPEAPADLDGVEVTELGPDSLAQFDREALRERARASVAAPTPSLRIPPGDPRLRIPARFAPVYVLRAGVPS